MKIKHFLIAAMAFGLMGCMTLAAQGKGTLTVQSNVSGAQVYLDGRLVGNATPTFSMNIPVRTYTLKVSKAGYQDFTTTVSLTSSGAFIQANLVAIGAAPAPAPTPAPAPAPAPAVGGKYTLAVNCNVAGAGILINGAMVGKAPYSAQYPAGTYTVVVRWGGYNDFTQTVTLNGNYTVNAVLTPTQPAPPPQYSFTVNANVAGANVAINGSIVGRAPYSAQLQAGSYTITVSYPGYSDWSQSVVVNGPGQVNAVLSPMQAPLSVNANVQGADVYINGNRVGRTPTTVQLAPGTYTVTVRAVGYGDFNQTVQLQPMGQAQVNAVLTALQAPLSVNANVQGADVYVNGSPVGRTPVTVQLAPGTYTVTVRAQGYGDFNQTVQLQPMGQAQVNAILTPVMSGWQVSIPDSIVNRDMKGGHWSQIMIYVDGQLQKGSSGQVGPGRHVLRVTSGGVAAEVVFDVQPGRTYVFEPFFGITVK
jgi:hypothetical protein